MAQLVQTPAERYARFERALITDRERKRVARAALDAAGEVHGSRLDSLILDAVALTLSGRSDGDPVRDAIMASLADVIRLFDVPCSNGFRSRLRSRLRVNTNLRTALAERAWADRGSDRGR